MKIALYGGSFDPPHISHIFSATYVSMVGEFDKIFVYPCYSSVTGKKLIDFRHRVNMCHLAMDHIPNVIISEIEKDLSEPSYTLNTVRYFKKIYPDAKFRLIVGSDIIKNQHLWKKDHLDEIYETAQPFILGRSGFDGGHTGVVMPDISSTKVRSLLSLNHPGVSNFLSTKVYNYIKKNNLYV